MMAFTNAAAGATAALLVAQYMNAGTIQSLLILSGGVIGSYMPDIDHPKSAFGSRVLPLSLPISAIFGHRGITHSLIAVVGVSHHVASTHTDHTQNTQAARHGGGI